MRTVLSVLYRGQCYLCCSGDRVTCVVVGDRVTCVVVGTVTCVVVGTELPVL